MRKTPMPIEKKLVMAAAVISAVGLTLLLQPSSDAGLRDPGCMTGEPANGVWERTAAANSLGVLCPVDSFCVEWCELSEGSECPTGQFCCLDLHADHSSFLACEDPAGPPY